VNRGATSKEIKTAYRQKARKFHPDVNKEPGAEATFKKISNAYEVLSDEQKVTVAALSRSRKSRIAAFGLLCWLTVRFGWRVVGSVQSMTSTARQASKAWVAWAAAAPALAVCVAASAVLRPSPDTRRDAVEGTFSCPGRLSASAIACVWCLWGAVAEGSATWEGVRLVTVNRRAGVGCRLHQPVRPV
jgi:hypothetical protein